MDPQGIEQQINAAAAQEGFKPEQIAGAETVASVDRYIDEMIEDLAPEETFTVAIDGKRTWTFRSIPDYSEWLRIEADAKAFVRQCRMKSLDPQEIPYIPVSNEAAAKIYLVHALLVEPALPRWAVLKLAQRLGAAFMGIAADVNQKSSIKSQRNDLEALTEVKKD